MKQKLTSEDVSCLVPALNKILDGSYLVQVYDGGMDDTKTIIMKFRNKVNDENKKKLSAMVHQSPDHLLAAAKFAFRFGRK